jgi:two-component system response regulator AtoC
VVSRDIASLRPLWSIARRNAWHLDTTATAWEALERIQSGIAPQMLIFDLPEGDADSLHVLRWLRRVRPDLPTLLLCHTADADKASDAIRMGANEVVVRPFREKDLQQAIYRYFGAGKTESEFQVGSEDIEPIGNEKFLVTASPVMQKLRVQAELLAQTDVPVLLVGEKGSGKQTVARLIHEHSVRSGFKFLHVNCAAQPSHVFLEKEIFGAGAIALKAASEKGTIFLDEITELPDHLQLRLLETLQKRQDPHVSVTLAGSGMRILASTKTNIERAIAERKLREDLYYKLSAFIVHVPPLRQRKSAIPVFLRHFMHSLAKHYGLPAREFSPPMIAACQQYDWPGNLGELEAYVKRFLVAGERDAILLSPQLELHSTEETAAPGVHPDEDQTGAHDARSLKSLIHDITCEAERHAIGIALKKTGWNRKAAARLLKVSYRTLLYKIEEYKLKPTESFVSPGILPGIAKGRAS